MRRLKASEQRERGAVAVMFALMITVLIAAVGLAVDLGATYAKKQELQNGADSAALAVAHECAVTGSSANCPNDAALAGKYSVGNVRNEKPTVSNSVSYPAAHNVTVEVTGTQQHWFMAALGFPSTDVTVDATAAWGPPEAGTSMLPLTISLCSFNAQGGASGMEATIMLPKPLEPVTSCIDAQSGNIMPSGFGYIGDGPAMCGAEVEVDGWVPSQGGNVPQGCDSTDFSAMIGKVVLLPIFDGCRTGATNVQDCTIDTTLSPSLREYHIYAFAAFKITGYNLGGSFKYNAPCSGNNRCIRGSFVEYVDIDSAYDYGAAPDLGVNTVLLID